MMLLRAVFFQLSGVVPMESAVPLLKESIRKAYGKKGEKVVMQNCAAVDGAVSALVKIDVPAAWANAVDAPEGRLGHSHTPAAQVGAQGEACCIPAAPLKVANLPQQLMLHPHQQGLSKVAWGTGTHQQHR
jgi:hypothetical protein